MLSSIGRKAIRRYRAGPFHTSSVRVGDRTWQAQRGIIALSSKYSTEVHSRPPLPFAPSFHRAYTTSSLSDAKATPARKSGPSTKQSTRKLTSKSATKPKAKPTKKVARKPKLSAKRELTDAQKEKRAELQAKIELKELKATALVSPPKALPHTAWTVLVSEDTKSYPGVFPGLKKSMEEISTKYKNLDPSEREHYNHIANQNKLANEVAYRVWVESHTPDQIKAANTARASLRRKLGKKGAKSYKPIEDQRIPKLPVNGWAAFTKERWASGDMKGISVVDATKTLYGEWTSLPAPERKHFEDVAAAARTRYAQEYKAAFHRDLPIRQRAAVAA